MGFYGEQILPRAIDWVMGGRGFSKVRRRALQPLAGKVLELGFGSGLNLPHYPPTVTRIQAIEPNAVARRLAARRLAASTIPVEFAGLDGQALALPDASVDAVLSTWTLCTIPDMALALAEVARVLRPGGQLHFLEHGLSTEPRVARWQQRLDPLQQRLAGGCHLNRPIVPLIAESGLALGEVDNFSMKGPRFATCLYAGTARRED